MHAGVLKALNPSVGSEVGQEEHPAGPCEKESLKGNINSTVCTKNPVNESALGNKEKL